MLHQTIHREIVWFYPWLRKMASGLMASERRSHTLQPTALANEVLAKLMSWKGDISGDTELSLRVLATTVAKQTLIDRGRRRTNKDLYMERMRHENANQWLHQETPLPGSRVPIVLDVIEQLESIDQDLASLVRMRFFEGCTFQQATERLGMSPRTAARRWAFAKTFLAKAIEREESR